MVCNGHRLDVRPTIIFLEFGSVSHERLRTRIVVGEVGNKAAKHRQRILRLHVFRRLERRNNDLLELIKNHIDYLGVDILGDSLCRGVGKRCGKGDFGCSFRRER
jgi:hypothetical protein